MRFGPRGPHGAVYPLRQVRAKRVGYTHVRHNAPSKKEALRSRV